MKLKTVFTLSALIAMIFMLSGAGCVQGEEDITGEMETPDNAVAVAVSEDRQTAYIADATKGLRIIDVSDVTHPVEKAAYEGAKRAFKVALNGKVCYLGDYMSGIRAVDTTDPNSLIINTSSESILPGSLSLMGDYLFSGDIKDGLKAFELNTAAPYFGAVSSCPYTTGVMAMTISESRALAFVVDNQKGLIVIDVSDPTNMQQTGGVLSTIKNANDIEVIGNYLYVATSEGVQIVDVSNINNPQLAGTFGNAPAFALYAAGDFLYGANGDKGLSQWDCSDRVSPERKMSRTFGSNKPVLDVAVSGEYAYLACETGGLVITTITD